MSIEREEFIKSLKVDNRRKVKNRPNRTKFNVRVAAGLAATLVALGLVACKDDGKPQNVNQPSTVTYSSTLTGEEKLENSVKKAEQDFLKRYLEGYNKQYGTDYKPYEAELVTNSIKEGVVYKVGDKLVTPGQFPALVKQELSKYGTVTTEDGHDKVMQILIDMEGEKIVLGTYNSSTLEAIYSGTQLESFNEILPDLEKLGISEELAQAIAELSKAKGVENEDSIRMRLDKYNKAKDFMDKGFEIEFE